MIEKGFLELSFLHPSGPLPGIGLRQGLPEVLFREVGPVGEHGHYGQYARKEHKGTPGEQSQPPPRPSPVTLVQVVIPAADQRSRHPQEFGLQPL